MIETGVFVPRRLTSARSRRVIYHAVQPGYQLALCFAEPRAEVGLGRTCRRACDLLPLPRAVEPPDTR